MSQSEASGIIIRGTATTGSSGSHARLAPRYPNRTESQRRGTCESGNGKARPCSSRPKSERFGWIPRQFQPSRTIRLTILPWEEIEGGGATQARKEVPTRAPDWETTGKIPPGEPRLRRFWFIRKCQLQMTAGAVPEKFKFRRQHS